MTDWRSPALAITTLGAIGAVGFAFSRASPPCEDYLRNVYASMEDCARDYSAAACSVERDGNQTAYVVGPWYIADRAKADPGPGATAVNSVSQLAKQTHGEPRRGGFGEKGFETSACS